MHEDPIFGVCTWVSYVLLGSSLAECVDFSEFRLPGWCRERVDFQVVSWPN